MTKSQMSSQKLKGNQGTFLKNKIKGRYNTSLNSFSLRPSITIGIHLVSLIIFILGGCTSEVSQKDMSLITGKLEQLENRITQLEAQFSETNESVTTLGSYITYLEERIEKLNKEIEKASLPKQEALSQENKQYHKVVRGDTLYSISKKYGLSVDEIRKLNSLNDSKPIQPGQKLMVVTNKLK
jgi:LysM repeat protein